MKRDRPSTEDPGRGPSEEIASSTMHGLGVLLGITGLVFLLKPGSDPKSVWELISYSIYGTGLTLLFLSSALYHGLPGSRTKTVLRAIDHSSIYLLIAGTYTPFTLVSLRGAWGWSLFGTVWGLAFVGISFNLFFPERFSGVETAAYVLMGWLSLVAIHRLLAAIGLNGILLLIAGGVVYTLGVAFYKWEQLPYNHAIWHLFVLGGAACHYFTVYLYVAAG